MEPEPAETFDARVARVVAELPDVERTAAGGLDELAVRRTVFARIGPRRLEALLDASIAAAALRTPAVAPGRGPGWVVFTPPAGDDERYTLDRAEAWLRFAHRRASTTRR